MAVHLIRLKWQLLLNGLRTDRSRAIGMPLFSLAMIVGGVVAARRYAGILQSLEPEAAAELSLWVAVVGAIAWGTLPVLLFPIDETLDPAKFAVLPIGRSQLMAGLIGAATLSPPMVFPAIVATVHLTAFTGLVTTPVAVVATVLILISMTVLGQTVTTAFSMLVKSRRGRDLTMFIVVALAIGIYAFQVVAARAVGGLGLAGALERYPMSRYSWLSPAGAAHQAVIEAAGGRYGLSAVFLLLAVVWIIGLVALWNRMLQRLITRPEPTITRQPARMTALTDARGWSAVGVVFRKELRSYLRDPRMRMVWTGGVIFIAVFLAAMIVGTTQLEVLQRSEWLVLASPTAVLFVGLPIALNQFGWERRAASFLFALPARPRDLLVGKNAATFVALAVETTVLALIAAVVTGGFRFLWMVPVLFFTASATQLAVGNVASVLTPLRLPDMGTDVFSQASEHGCLAIGSQLVAFFTIGLLLVPVAVAVVLSQMVPDAVPPWAVSIGAMAWGALVYWVALVFSSRSLGRRMPEILRWVQVV